MSLEVRTAFVVGIVAAFFGLSMTGCTDEPESTAMEAVEKQSTPDPKSHSASTAAKNDTSHDKTPTQIQDEAAGSVPKTSLIEVTEGQEAVDPEEVDNTPIEVRLLEELDAFRNEDSFAYYGFATGGPHHDWLTRVQKSRERTDLDVTTKISLGELMMLGQEYRKTKGAENKDTRWFRRRVLDPLGDD